jgi:hypothetical protein
LPGQITRLAAEVKGGRVCEIGAGPNPMLSADDLARLDVEYVCLDVSQDELDKASGVYHKVCADVVRGGAELPGDFDLVLSRARLAIWRARRERPPIRRPFPRPGG